MFAILFCTVIGFLTGLVLLMFRRKIKPNTILAATFLGLLTAGAYKFLRDLSRAKKKKHHF